MSNIATFSELNVDTLKLSKGFEGEFVLSGGDLDVKQSAFIRGKLYANIVAVSTEITTERLTANQAITANSDVDISGNLTIHNGDIYANHSIAVLGNAQIYENILLGNSGTYIYTPESGHMGINTRNATATLDISGASTNTLNVYSGQTETFNVLARNVANRGISLYSNTTTSRVGFHNDQTIDASRFDATIAYSSGGILTLDVSRNTNILSGLSVSTTNRADHLLDETVVIYDTSSATPYLYDVYKDNAKKTGNALSLVPSDASSNTFLNLVSTNKRGMGIGGGGIYDRTRTMGTLGLYDAKGKYVPSINVVSGNTNTQYKTTVGINTHAPLVDKYILNVNGPIRVSNGEITLMEHVNFQIRSISISRTHPRYGIAVGTPFTLTSPFRQKTLYTNDGGDTWLPSFDLSGDTIENLSNYIQDVYVMDDRLSVLVADNGHIRFSTNGGKDWYLVAHTISGNIEFKTAFVSCSESGRIRIFINTTDRVYWTDTPNNIYTLETGFTRNRETDGYLSITNITRVAGYNNSLFVICANEIRRYSDIHSVPPYFESVIYNPFGTNYTDISVYNGTYATAISGNSVSYTQDGGSNWSHTPLPPEYDLRRIYVYDPSNAVAVGNNGIIAYTRDGNRTWNLVPPNILNSSGNAGILTDPTLNLTGIVFRDLHNFIITQNIASYTYPTATGKTDIYHVFCPSLFDNANNYVLDVSGSSHFSGDINVNQDGQITTTNSTFYLLNQTAQRIFMGGDASAVYLGNATASNVIANHNFEVKHDASMNRDVSVEGNTRLRKNVYVHGDASFGANVVVVGDTSLNSMLRVDGNTFLNRRVFVLGDASFGANVVVVGDTSLNSVLRVDGNTFLNRRVSVLGDASFGANVVVVGNTSLNGVLHVDGNTFLNQRVSVLGDASFGANVVVVGDTSLNSVLRVDGDTFLNRRVFFSGDASFGANVVVVGNTSLNSVLHVDGNTFLNRRVSVLGDASFGANVVVVGNTSLNSVLRVDGNTFLNRRVFVLGDASFGANVVVVGNTSLNSVLRVDGNTFLNRRLFALGDASFGANVVVVGDTSLNSVLRVNGNTFLNRNLSVLGDASFSANVRVLGDASFNQSVTILGNTVLRGNLQVSDTQIVYSKYYEGTSDNTNIYIGTRGLYVEGASIPPSRTIYIGNNGTGQQDSENIIKIGGGNDSIILGGKGVSIEKINAGKFLAFNEVEGGPGKYGQSKGAGIHIYDNSANEFAGLFVVSEDTNGYLFRAPGNTNTVKMDISAIAIPPGSNINRALLSVYPSTDTANSKFTIGVGAIDISNILLKTYSETDPARNIQIIDTNMGIRGNAYITKTLVVGKDTAIRANTTAEMVGNVYVDKLNIGTDGSLNTYKLEIQGNIYQHSGLIWQF